MFGDFSIFKEKCGKYSYTTVKFYDGRQFDAELVGSDEATDIAVLRIEAEGLTELPLGDSSNARAGRCWPKAARYGWM